MTDYPHSREQSFTAMGRANSVRLARAKAKRELAALGYDESRDECARWLERNAEFMATMRVYDLLCAVRRFGPLRVRSVLRAAGCSETMTVGGMTARQRAGVCAALRLDMRPRLTQEVAA